MRLLILALCLVACGSSEPDYEAQSSATLPDGAVCPREWRVCPGRNGCVHPWDPNNCGRCGNVCTRPQIDCNTPLYSCAPGFMGCPVAPRSSYVCTTPR